MDCATINEFVKDMNTFIKENGITAQSNEEIKTSISKIAPSEDINNILSILVRMQQCREKVDNNN
jgi:hypothetical protein